MCQTPLAASLVSGNKCRLSLDSSFFSSMIYLIYDGYTHIFLCTMSRRISLPWRFLLHVVLRLEYEKGSGWI